MQILTMPTPLLALLLSAASFSAADSTPKFVVPKTLPELEARIRTVLDSSKVPGVGLAIVRHDSIIYIGGIGRARVAPAASATDLTLFRIGSTSKAFVALTAQALVREGKLDLAMPLSEALPGFVFQNRWESADPVRIVHLLEHTSGFDDNSLQSYANNDPKPLTTAEGLAIDERTRVSRWRPGTRFSYCNTGPAIVALLIERIEGKPFEQVIQERWFTPLGMRTATYFRPDTAALSVATLYREDGVTPVRYWNIFVRSAGAINANARDMAAYVRFLLGRGTIDGKQLLPPEAIDRMEHSQSSLMSRAGLAVGYGLHLYRIADTTGFTWTGHNGGVEGGLSDLSYLPTHGVGYAFQINSGNGDALGKITTLVRAYLTQDLTRPAEPAVAPIAAPTRTRYSGWYRDVSPRAQHLYATEHIPSLARISFTESTMTMNALLGSSTEYVAVDSVRFRRRGASEATLVFVADDANGRPQGIEAVGSGLGGSFARVSAFNALGGFAVALVFVAGLLTSLVAMLFGTVRWMVRRLRHRPDLRSAAATPWRLAALAAVFVLANVLFVLIGTDDLQRIGTLSLFSGGAYATGLLFALVAFAGVWLSWRARGADRTWGKLSLWSARLVNSANAATAVYLIYWGWIGWRTWV